MAAASEKHKAQMRERYRAKRPEYLARNVTHYRANRATRDEQVKAWKDAHPDVKRSIRFADNANQRARRRGIPGRLRAAELRALVGPCAYCAGEADTYDHVHPLYLGGPNAIENVVPACQPCNWRKGRKVLADAGDVILRDRVIRMLVALAH